MKIFSNFRDVDSDPYLLYIKKICKGKPFTFWYDKFPTNIDELKINPYNFLFLHEPNEFFGTHSQASEISSFFTSILTWNESLLNKHDNTFNFTYNGQTLDDIYINNLQPKEFNVSFLCGTKKLVEGHNLRQKVYKLKDLINIPKKWFYVLDDYDLQTDSRPGYTQYSKDLSHIPEGIDPIGYGRRTLFDNSMFNVIIENVKYNNWYNKIGDNFASKTVPIYWGCPNISEFGYDERGIIRFETDKELLNIINSLTPQKYNQMLPYIEHNYKLTKQDTFEINISNFFDELIKLNNL